MSREIDMANLTEDDKVYLAQRGQLPTDIASEQEQRKMLSLDTPSLEDLANTGDVNLRNVTKEELEAELERRREDEVQDPRTLMSKAGLEAAEVDEDDENDEEVPYSEWTNGALRAEIASRNESRAEDDQLPVTGKKEELVATLEADDAEE